MANDAGVKTDFTILDRVLNMFRGAPYVKIGILGSSTSRKIKANKREVATNAAIGFKNEFGSVSEHIPARSFLQMPIKLKFNEYMAKSEKLNKAAFEKALKEGTIFKFMTLMGINGERCVLDAFATRGSGKWKPNSPKTVALKGSDSPLIDTGELRKSITSSVENVKKK